ncbi:MAG: response regulator transcription factor [Chloroflexota bacterium]
MTHKILAVDDSEHILSILEVILNQAGYHTILSDSGTKGLIQFQDEKPDLVILDVNMPEMNGWDVCRKIREVSEVPIIFLTAAHVSIEDKIQGFDLGANDYITKPFHQKEFLARVRANLRISPMLQNQHVYDDGYLKVDFIERCVSCDKKNIDLTEKEFGLLRTLIQSPNQTVTNEVLFQKVWGYPESFDPNYVRIYTSSLRRKIEPDHKNPVYILTDRGRGYRFISNQE